MALKTYTDDTGRIEVEVTKDDGGLAYTLFIDGEEVDAKSFDSQEALVEAIDSLDYDALLDAYDYDGDDTGDTTPSLEDVDYDPVNDLSDAELSQLESRSQSYWDMMNRGDNPNQTEAFLDVVAQFNDTATSDEDDSEEGTDEIQTDSQPDFALSNIEVGRELQTSEYETPLEVQSEPFEATLRFHKLDEYRTVDALAVRVSNPNGGDYVLLEHPHGGTQAMTPQFWLAKNGSLDDGERYNAQSVRVESDISKDDQSDESIQMAGGRTPLTPPHDTVDTSHDAYSTAEGRANGEWEVTALDTDDTTDYVNEDGRYPHVIEWSLPDASKDYTISLHVEYEGNALEYEAWDDPLVDTDGKEVSGVSKMEVTDAKYILNIGVGNVFVQRENTVADVDRHQDWGSAFKAHLNHVRSLTQTAKNEAWAEFIFPTYIASNADADDSTKGYPVGSVSGGVNTDISDNRDVVRLSKPFTADELKPVDSESPDVSKESLKRIHGVGDSTAERLAITGVRNKDDVDTVLNGDELRLYTPSESDVRDYVGDDYTPSSTSSGQSDSGSDSDDPRFGFDDEWSEGDVLGFLELDADADAETVWETYRDKKSLDGDWGEFEDNRQSRGAHDYALYRRFHPPEDLPEEIGGWEMTNPWWGGTDTSVIWEHSDGEGRVNVNLQSVSESFRIYLNQLDNRQFLSPDGEVVDDPVDWDWEELDSFDEPYWEAVEYMQEYDSSDGGQTPSVDTDKTSAKEQLADIKGIGEKTAKQLVDAGITDKLELMDSLGDGGTASEIIPNFHHTTVQEQL